MISISSVAFSPTGYLLVKTPLKSSTIGARERRVSRIKTLDNGYALNDTGECVCDRTERIVWKGGADDLTTAQRLVSIGRVTVSMSDGVYLGVASNVSSRGDEITLTILILERLDG